MRFIRSILISTICLGSTIQAQFLQEFDDSANDNNTPAGWSTATGDGQATIQFVQNTGYASVQVDATKDKNNIWWALIRTPVPGIDIRKLMDPEYELRVEARIRTSHAPRRVNLHFNHQRTTDYHSHLMEYDIPEAGKWHVISMTTKGFEVQEGDQINAQMALMDWGTEQYQLDVDYFKVDVVKAATANPDLGNPLPYHPTVPEPESFKYHLPILHDVMIDRNYPELNFNDWEIRKDSGFVPVQSVSQSQIVLLRWDLKKFTGKKSAGPAVLELTTMALQRSPVYKKDFGMVRVKEILGGDPEWNQQDVTFNSFCKGIPIDKVINSQMVIDYPVNPEPMQKSYFVINQQVMDRLLSGECKGLAIEALGAVNATFFSRESSDSTRYPRLLFNLK